MDPNFYEEQMWFPNGSMLWEEPFFTGLERRHGCIEERIGVLEAVTARARQQQRRRHGLTSPQVVNIFSETATVNAQSDGGVCIVNNDTNFQERPAENRRPIKRFNGELVAKALGIDINKRASTAGGFFDCNICLSMARDPVLTSCGHLFCWPCFYQLPCIYSNVKECPECNGEVTDATIIPIYGNGENGDNCKSKSKSKSKSKESSSNIPPRPQAHRMESVRQNRTNQRVFPSPIEESIQQLRSIIGVMSDGTQPHDVGNANATSERSNRVPTTETLRTHPRRPVRISRLLSAGAASYSSLTSALSSAMDSAERLVEDLEAYLGHNRRRSLQASSQNVDRQLLSHIPAVVRPDSMTLDTAAGINSTVSPSASSPIPVRVAANVVSPENSTGASTEVNPVATFSFSSSRRRNEPSGTSSVDAGISHPSRRRRLE